MVQIDDGTNSEEDESERRRLRGCGGVPMLMGVVYVSSSKYFMSSDLCSGLRRKRLFETDP